MDDVLDFIRDFRMADYGFSGWHLLIAAVTVLTCWIVLPRMIAFTKIWDITKAKKVVNFACSVLLYAFLLVLILNAVLNENYLKLFTPLIILIMQKNLVDKFYTFYDKFIDRVTDKTIKNPNPDRS